MKAMQEITAKFIDSLNSKLDEKIKECLQAWNVNLNDHKEIERRCQLSIFEDGSDNEIRIDGYLVMLFGSWQFETPQINRSIVPLNISASYRCSEIMKPEDYNLK